MRPLFLMLLFHLLYGEAVNKVFEYLTAFGKNAKLNSACITVIFLKLGKRCVLIPSQVHSHSTFPSSSLDG